MKIIKTRTFAAVITLAVVLFSIAIVIHGCGSESYDRPQDAASSLTCGGASTGTTSSVVINDDVTTTLTNNVKLKLHAEDADDVVAYYVSESSTPPTAGDPEWVPITDTPCTVLDGTGIDFSLTPASTVGWHTRTVYFWFKDGLDNVSTATSDDIILVVAASGC